MQEFLQKEEIKLTMKLQTQAQNYNNSQNSEYEMGPASRWWNWKTVENEGLKERTLFLNGTIAEESWFDDDVTPRIFKEELFSDSGNITIWINSPGGDCIAAAQIYNMLMDYKGDVTIKIDGIAASAASVIAMAGTKVLVSPVSMMMIHNPATMAWGDSGDMKKAISMLDEVKESIINAYEIKTGMARNKLSHLMDLETWMNAGSAIELGFADEMLTRTGAENMQMPEVSSMYQKLEVTNCLMKKLASKCEIKPKAEERKIDSLYERLDLIKKHI